MLEEGRTQPSFHFPLWPTIPITSVLGSSPTLSFLAASLRVSRSLDHRFAKVKRGKYGTTGRCLHGYAIGLSLGTIRQNLVEGLSSAVEAV